MDSASEEALRGLPFAFPHSHTIASGAGAAGLSAFTLCLAAGQAAFIPYLRHLREAGYPLTGCVVKPRSGENGTPSAASRFQADTSRPASDRDAIVRRPPRRRAHRPSYPAGAPCAGWDKSADRPWIMFHRTAQNPGRSRDFVYSLRLRITKRSRFFMPVNRSFGICQNDHVANPANCV